MLIYLMKGSLPWQGQVSKAPKTKQARYAGPLEAPGCGTEDEIMHLKIETSIQELVYLVAALSTGFNSSRAPKPF